MSEQIMTEKLMKFGLTRQEAVLYLLLLRSAALTGYEAAKQTGISRSNTYSALAGLTEKGAAYMMEGQPVKYVPVNMEEFCKNKIHELEEDQTYLKAHAPTAKETAEGYITVEGYTNICNKMHHMLEQTEHRIYLSMAGSRLYLLREDLEALIARQRKVVILTDTVFDLAGATVWKTEDKGEQIRLIIDSDRVLTGEFGAENNICLYSGQKNFVDVLKDALRNEIRLIGYERTAYTGRNNDGPAE